MKRFLLLLLLSITAISCNSASNKYIVLEDGDTLSTSYLVGERRVGNIHRGTSSHRLNAIFGEKYVKQLKMPDDSDTTARKIFYIYNENNHLELIAHTREEIGDDLVNHIIIKDKHFETAKGINMQSSVGEIARAYPDATVINHNGIYYIFVSHLDLYFGVKSLYVEGSDSEFVEDIPLDSVKSTVIPDTMSVSWYSQKSDMFSALFWEDILARIIRWLLYELPSIAFIIVIFVICKRLTTIVVNNIRRVTRKRIESSPNIDNYEAIK